MFMHLGADTITALASVVMAIGTLGAFGINFFSLRSMKKQLEIQKESFKRSSTINTLATWLKTFERKAILARHILSELNEDDIKKIYNFEDISLKDYQSNKIKKIKHLIYALNPQFMEDPNIKGDLIPNHITTYIRSLMTEYLNTLEIILLAWDQRIVDEDVFIKEFDYLLNDNNQCILDKILSVWGRRNYPIIDKFCNKLKDKRTKIDPSKKPL